MAKRASGNSRGSRGAGKGRARGGQSRTRAASTKKAAGTKKRAGKSSATRAGAARGGSKRAAPKRATAARPGVKGHTKTTAPGRRSPGASQARRPAGTKAPSARKSSKLGRVAVAVGGTVAGVVAAVTRTVSRRPANDAITLLERDHRRMEDLLKRAEETSPAAVQGRGQLLDAITSQLRAHEMIEEQVFYPALREHPEAKDLVLEGFEEHHAADVTVKELRELPPAAEQWAPKMKVLQEMIQHHIDEEEGEMFRTARAVLSRDELAALGRRMAAMKAQAPGA